MNKKNIDITEIIEDGNLSNIIVVLKNFIQNGYDKLHWDGYDSSIYLYKSKEENSVDTSSKSKSDFTISLTLPPEIEKLLIDQLKKY